MAAAQYLVDYRLGGQGSKPWHVYRLVPRTVCASTKVFLVAFATENEALRWCEDRHRLAKP